MAKKLFVGNYRFDASEQVVYVQGNVQPEKFLLITNTREFRHLGEHSPHKNIS